MFLGGYDYGYDYGNLSSGDAYIRALVFFLLSVALLVIYILQQGFTIQSFIWMFVIVAGTAASVMKNNFMGKGVVGLVGISLGMVLGNATIQLK
jgi:hypothetical protein